MAVLAWILGILGGMSAVMGVITAVELVEPFYTAFTPMFWLALAGVLLLGAIASAVGRSAIED